MGSQLVAWSNAGVRSARPDTAHGESPSARSGVAILDEEYRPLALDSGAKAIFETLNGPSNGKVPDAILSRLQSRRIADGDVSRVCLNAGGDAYSWRAFVVKHSARGDAMLTLHFRREATLIGAVRRIATEYNLTAREHEALAGLLMGLPRWELAARMRISHNTVKALVRLAMTKMGVNSRSQLYSKLLDAQAG